MAAEKGSQGEVTDHEPFQLNGIWTMLFLGRASMIPAWIDLIRKRFARSHDFVSVDAKGFSTGPRQYEMITSPSQTAYATVKTPQAAVTSPSIDGDTIAVLSPESQQDQFPRDAKYVSPTMSFSTPRPPSSGRHQDREWDPTSTFARPLPPSIDGSRMI